MAPSQTSQRATSPTKRRWQHSSEVPYAVPEYLVSGRRIRRSKGLTDDIVQAPALPRKRSWSCSEECYAGPADPVTGKRVRRKYGLSEELEHLLTSTVKLDDFRPTVPNLDRPLAVPTDLEAKSPTLDQWDSWLRNDVAAILRNRRVGLKDLKAFKLVKRRWIHDSEAEAEATVFIRTSKQEKGKQQWCIGMRRNSQTLHLP